MNLHNLKKVQYQRNIYNYYLPAYLSTYLPTHLPTYLPIYLPTYLPTSLPILLHNYKYLGISKISDGTNNLESEQVLQFFISRAKEVKEKDSKWLASEGNYRTLMSKIQSVVDHQMMEAFLKAPLDHMTIALIELFKREAMNVMDDVSKALNGLPANFLGDTFR
jgi:hypothetical protein